MDTGIGNEPAVHYFTMGQEAWKSSETWPPAGTRDTAFYLAANHALAAEPPADAAAEDSYRVDPKAGTGGHARWNALR